MRPPLRLYPLMWKDYNARLRPSAMFPTDLSA